MKRYRFLTLILLLLTFFATPHNVMADAIGTWKLYPCYSDIKEIVPAGDDIFVLASGNLYSYNIKDNSITTYEKTTCLTSNDITHIAWVNNAKRLVVSYSDYTFDLLSLNQEVTNIRDLADKQMTGDKTINDIYVYGKHAYISTGFGIIKLNVVDEYIADSYNLGYTVNYCYIEGNYIYAASSSNGLMRAPLNANLLNKNTWERVANYTEKTKEEYVADTRNNCYWAGNANSELTQYKKQEDGNIKENTMFAPVKPDGPVSNNFWRLYKHDGKIFATAGNYSYGIYLPIDGLVQYFENDKWSTLTSPSKDVLATKYEMANCMVFDPKDPKHFWIGAVSGLYEYRDTKVVHAYNPENSPLVPLYNSQKTRTQIGSMCYDSDNNLWIMGGYCDKYITCLTNEGTWKSFPHTKYTIDNGLSIDQQSVYISKNNGYMWWTNGQWDANAIFRYDYKSDNLKDVKSFVNQDGTSLTVHEIFGLTEDRQGNIWIASSAGPFYLSSEEIHAGNMETFVQHKVPRNDGTNYADYLLDGISIRCIKIDLADRKWMGTASNGIYLISSDNNTQVYHFTTENSPIPSDMIYDILIDDATGVIYIATDKGLCSFKADISQENTSEDGMSKDNVWAYPNPVSPDYNCMITVVGLTPGAQVQILTSSGHIVSEGTCMGGSYQWNGCDRNGDKVASGMYMVCVATAEGKKGIVTKIGIVR